MDRDGLTRVLQAFEQEDWDEVHLVADGVELHLAAGGGGPSSVKTSHVSASTGGLEPTPAVAVDPAPAAATPAVPPGGPVDEIVAPSPGIFWRAPSPGAPPFTDTGRRVDADAVLCIVEVMKLMNTITAPRPGVVVDVLVGNGEQVERGQALFRIRPDGA
jgi:acetyl-CoA carboxylase biotin carboxyl carrier protein